jgi:chemotaxis protein CheC
MYLTKKQLDALKEVGNIGCGNAASALAEFLNRRVHMSVPTAEILSLEEITTRLKPHSDTVVSVALKLMGGVSGSFLFIITKDTALKIINYLIPASNVSKLQELEELETSCLMEICNILGGAFSNALSILVKGPVLNSLPALELTTVKNSVATVISNNDKLSEQVLMIETSFIEKGENLTIHIFLLPTSLEALLENIGVNSNA